VSRWFVIDNTPPEVKLEHRSGTWSIVASDALSSIASVQWSRDGQEWRTLDPDDGVLDGRDESFSFPAEEGRHLIVIRVMDTHHNRTVVGAAEDS
jgi:hypothetical protein